MTSVAMAPSGQPVPGGALLSTGELKTMLNQCLKLASENKITAANTWVLPLIEHMDDLIKTEPDSEVEGTSSTNFQRASVTLDAGVKIYGYRVDSVHSETYKILGGLGRASGNEEREGEGMGWAGGGRGGKEDGGLPNSVGAGWQSLVPGWQGRGMTWCRWRKARLRPRGS